jgi:hypothetical protein|nr:MAG TPA: hypothetical protein [Caudoviricetes sp.]
MNEELLKALEDLVSSLGDYMEDKIQYNNDNIDIWFFKNIKENCDKFLSLIPEGE